MCDLHTHTLCVCGRERGEIGSNTLQHTATHYNTLQHTATTLQHTATHCNSPPPPAIRNVDTVSPQNEVCFYHFRCTGWRRLIGSPKLQIIFHKRATKYRSLLRKMTYKDKGSYDSTPPCSPLSLIWDLFTRITKVHNE